MLRIPEITSTSLGRDHYKLVVHSAKIQIGTLDVSLIVSCIINIGQL